MSVQDLLAAAVVGAGATLAIDAWNGLLFRTFGVRSLSYCMLGRWFRYMPHGRFVHASLAGAPSKSHECAVGWMAHYTIGATLGVVFVGLVTPRWLDAPTPLPALAYGLATLVFPFLVMQPAFGLGVAASRTPNPGLARLKSVGTHTVFGLALFGLARAWAMLQP